MDYLKSNTAAVQVELTMEQEITNPENNLQVFAKLHVKINTRFKKL